MAIRLGNAFSTNEKVVSQCDNQTLRFSVEMLDINFDQEKFEEHLSQGSKSSLFVRKHRLVSIAKVPLANSLNQAFTEAKLAQCKAKSASAEVKSAQCELLIATGEISKIIKQSVSTSGEANRVPSNPISTSCEAKRASPSLNALPALGKAKAQACNAKALPRSTKKASGKASVLVALLLAKLKPFTGLR